MILVDSQIRLRMGTAISTPPLLGSANDENVRNCGYILRAGKVFEPHSGNELLLTGDGVRKPRAWEIGPSETLVVMTEETINMPSDLCASYTPLYRLARQGVMLLNAAVVEPGYAGPLSCYLLNFSSARISIGPRTPIAKIVFHTLSQNPTEIQREVIDSERYEQSLADSAKGFQESFLDVAGIEDRAAQKAKAAIEEARQSIRQSILAAGIIVSLLLVWASLEPVFSKWLWEKTGITTSTQRVEDATLRQELIRREAKEAELARQLRKLKLEVDTLKARTQPRGNK